MRIGLRTLKTETVECLVFNAVTASRMFSLDRYARDEPETPAAEGPAEDVREVIGIVLRGRRLLPLAERGRPFPPDIRNWVLLLARSAGWQPSIRRPLPRSEVLWRACVALQTLVRATQEARVRRPCHDLRLCQM